MPRRSEENDSWEERRARIIGLGENSSRKSYYPELMKRLSELEETKKSLAKANAFLLAVMDSATEVSIIATDVTGMITLFNRGAEMLLGYRAEEVIGRMTSLSFHLAAELAEQAAEVNATYGLALSGFSALVERTTREGSDKREWTYRCQDQSHVQIKLVITAIYENGLVSGYLGIAEEITARKALEQTLRQSNDTLEMRVRQRTAELEEKNAELARMNKHFVGRELRMMELKQKIKELEEKGE